jgi:hypothetical protein
MPAHKLRYSENVNIRHNMYHKLHILTGSKFIYVIADDVGKSIQDRPSSFFDFVTFVCCI